MSQIYLRRWPVGSILVISCQFVELLLLILHLLISLPQFEVGSSGCNIINGLPNVVHLPLVDAWNFVSWDYYISYKILFYLILEYGTSSLQISQVFFSFLCTDLMCLFKLDIVSAFPQSGHSVLSLLCTWRMWRERFDIANSFSQWGQGFFIWARKKI